MRTLKFIVENQLIKQDPFCDFEGLVPGTKEYLKADFSFSSEWNGSAKVVSFFSALGKEYESILLKDGKTCIIPAEALKKRVFKVQVTGGGRDLRIVTNRLAVRQDGGKV